jgi:phospholipase/lecithinase/hemolysin
MLHQRPFVTKALMLLLLGAPAFAQPVKTGMPAPAIKRLYVFGDSYSDIGEGYLDGNGPTAVYYFAKRLGIELYPSNSPTIQGKSLDYAVSGAQSGAGPGRTVKGALLGYGMQNQVADFAAKVKSHAVTFDPGATLFYLAGGLNDARLPEGSTATNEANLLRTLYALGARKFEIAILTTAIPGFGQTGLKINPSLEALPQLLAHDIPGAEIRISHWGRFFDEVLAHPEQFGITNTKDACAGRAIFDQDATPCARPETYYFYHQNHPSTVTHKAVGDKMYDEYLSTH